MAKYQEICDILVTRIRQGEYADSQLPNLRQLAEDMGVSYLTARQAVNQLKTQGILASDASGRRTLVKAELGSRPRVALITPFWHISEWHLTIRKVVLELGGQLKVFACTTSTDTTIDDALNGSFDLIFIQLPETPPPRLLERMSKCSDKIVTLFQDYTAYGIRALECDDADAARPRPPEHRLYPDSECRPLPGPVAAPAALAELSGYPRP